MWENTQNLIKSETRLSPKRDKGTTSHSLDIVEWTEKYRTIKGKPFSFEQRDYLKQIYRDPAKEIYIVKPRQMEITELAINWLLHNLLKYPNTVGLYVTDRHDHISVFSKTRLRKAISGSEFLRSQVESTGNESCVQFCNGSTLFMFSGWDNFEQARSLAVDFVVVDELQSLNVDAIPVLKETLTRSENKRILGIGTGSDYGDHWWELWHTGNQCEWDKETSAWIPKCPQNIDVASYHLSQFMTTLIPANVIETKRLRYSPRHFANEVEGLWFKGARKPLLEPEIRALFDRTLSLQSADEVDYTKGKLFLGVDWGGGTKAFTIAWIWQLVDESAPMFRLVYVSKITERSTEKQADMIAQLVDKYNIDKGVMDAGGGTRQVQKLEELYPTRMLKASYMTRPADPFEYVESENRIAVDRTYAIEIIIDLVTRPQSVGGAVIPRLVIPAREPERVEWIIDQFTCIDAVSLSGGKNYVKYTHPEESPDDALHACIYAYLALEVTKRETPWFYVSGY